MKHQSTNIFSLHTVLIFVITLVLTFNAGAQATKSNSKAAAKPDASTLLNIASRQPMLAERITKSFLMMTRNVLTFRSRNHLEESLAEFETNLNQLLAAAPTTEIRDNYELLEQLFEELKSIKSKPVNKQSAAELAEQNEELVWIAQKGANLLQAHTKSARNDLIATAGEVRVLTQRLAKLYLFRTSGIRSTVIVKDLKKAEEDYRIAIERLVRAPQNTEQIKQELVLAETQWLFLRGAIERLNADQTSMVQLEHVSKTCDNILSVMEKIAGLYALVKV